MTINSRLKKRFCVQSKCLLYPDDMKSIKIRCIYWVIVILYFIYANEILMVIWLVSSRFTKSRHLNLKWDTALFHVMLSIVFFQWFLWFYLYETSDKQWNQNWWIDDATIKFLINKIWHKIDEYVFSGFLFIRWLRFPFKIYIEKQRKF